MVTDNASNMKDNDPDDNTSTGVTDNTKNLNDDSTATTKELETKINKYTPFWDEKDVTNDDKVVASKSPSFHLYISHQKLGTETEAVPYPTTTDNNVTTVKSDNNNTSTGDNTDTSGNASNENSTG